MFVLKVLIDRHQERVREWEKARDKWVAADLYRTKRQYRVPRPGENALFIAKLVMAGIVALAFLGSAGFVIYDEVRKPEPPKPDTQDVVYKDGDKCNKYFINDIAVVQWGEYSGAEVKIVGGCDKSGYKVTTTKDQVLFAAGSENEQLDDKKITKGLSFYVDDSRNLSITGHSKE